MQEKKKIGIVTVYNSYNYGSILQARSLYDYLKNYGEVYFINTHARNSVKLGIKEVLKALKSFKPHRLIFEIKRFYWFESLERKLPIISVAAANDICDTFVFGSDEIWNIARKQFSEYPIFGGEGLFGKKVAYGPTLNNTTPDDLQKGAWVKKLDEFIALSVRDQYSKKVLENILGKAIDVVVDPTMLSELQIEKCSACRDKYIAMYVSDNKFIKKKEIKDAIKGLAKEQSLKLVSLGLWSDWADYNFVDMINPPFYYYSAADYVITNTFHGTVFAILQKKKFVSFAEKNRKIIELLNMLSLGERLVHEDTNKEQLWNVLNKEIDYDKTFTLLSIHRNASRNYLKDSL